MEWSGSPASASAELCGYTLAVLLLLIQLAQAACPAPATPRDVLQGVVRGEVAFQNGDAQALDLAALTVRAQIPCLDAPLDLHESAAVFRLWAYDAFVGRDKPAAARFFAVAKDLEPVFELPLVVVPEHHPMRALYRDLPASPPQTRLLDIPERSRVWVNGIEAVVYPTDRPSIVQQVAGREVLYSAVLEPGEAPPILVGNEVVPYEWGLTVAATTQVWVREGRATGTLGPAVRADFPIAAGLGADAALSTGLSVVKQGLIIVPELRAGLRWQLEGPLHPRAGAALLIASHSYAPVAPGAALTLGMRTGSLDLDLHGGYAGGLNIGVMLGRVLR